MAGNTPLALTKPILLASGSPRRKFLLEQAGYHIRIVVPDIDEVYPKQINSLEVPEYLARQKAKAAIAHIRTGETIIAADSIVIQDGKILGKPRDENEARTTLYKLSGKIHQVITGVCLKNKVKEFVFSSTTQVHFYPLEESEIDYYIKKYQPNDKAGSYGIQEWIGWCKVAKIIGSYSNVMGLPMAQLYGHLTLF